MASQRYSPKFKDEAVRQVINHRYSVSKVSSESFKSRSPPAMPTVYLTKITRDLGLDTTITRYLRKILAPLERITKLIHTTNSFPDSLR